MSAGDAGPPAGLRTANRPEADTPGRRLHRSGMATRGCADDREAQRAHERAWLDRDNADLRARYEAWAEGFLAAEARVRAAEGA